MERLSNIMRTAQRPYMPADQRVPQQLHTQGQRPPTPVRRPQAEQNPRRETTSRPAGLYQARPAPSPRLPEIPEEQWEAPGPLSTRPPASRATYSGSPRIPRAAQEPRYAELPPRGDYYDEEERSTVVPADVQEDWGDDTAGMRYGDWEDEPGYGYASNYQEEERYAPPVSRVRESSTMQRPPTQEISAAAQRLAQIHNQNNPLATRELYRVAPENTRPPVSRDPRDPRDLREARLPVPAAGSQLTPAPQGLRQAQRNTQPLKPQQMGRIPSEMQPRSQPPLRATLPNTPRETSADYTITVGGVAASACPLCKGAGFLRSNVPFGHPQFGKPMACKCKEQERKRKRRQQLHELSNLGAFANKRFDSFNPRVPGLQEAFQIAVEFAKGPDGWLLFVGPNGCGKTHLAAAIANQCLEAGAVVLFATVPDLLDHLRAAFAPTSEEVFDQLFARMREAEVLVLDDLGTQQSSPWANEKLFQLLNYRYNSGFPTVITANPRGLQATDERIRSRLGDNGLVITLNLDRARDYRPNNPRRD